MSADDKPRCETCTHGTVILENDAYRVCRIYKLLVAIGDTCSQHSPAEEK